jgi:glutamate-1-semialdehyde 2,1-aminomutase
MSSLNCYEEVQLAEALIRLHPWAGGVRFARSGGESCSIAVRIARAYTGRDVVLFSGYHGWHDWYLATNLANSDNLNSQLLPGLEPAGVPSSLTESVFPFMEGDLDAFDAYIENYKGQIGAVMMEIWRYQDPDLDFIHHVQKRCQEEEIILIFDEISSGFRLSTGGSHSIWDLEPDICVLGKALGNGHPIGAVIGRDNIMDAAQSSFISSSYWTERVGFAASLKVLEIFERDNIVEGLKSSGLKIKNGLNQLIGHTELDIKVVGVDSVPIIAFGGDFRLEVKTLFTQEMLKRGFLAGNVIYVSHAHRDEDIESYLDAVCETLAICQKGLKKGFDGYLDGPVCHSGFQRLTKS